MFRISQYMRDLVRAQASGHYPAPTPRGAGAAPGPVVIWNLIRRCNLTCQHCYALSADHDYAGELDTAEVFHVMDDLKAFRVPVLILSGGEPLLRPDLFHNFHAYALEYCDLHKEYGRWNYRGARNLDKLHAAAKGNQELGAPNLTDAIWLYGSDEATIIDIIANSRGSVMPAWVDRLDPVTVKSLDAEKNRVVLDTICQVAGKTVLEGEATVMAPK